MNIGQRIKERRKLLGLTADALGAKLGKDRSTIYRYEKGDIENLPLDILEPIAAALDTTPQQLMGWDSTLPSPTVTEDVVVFPVIGEVAAGFEHIAAEEWTGDKIEVPKSMLHGRKKEDFFVLSVVGDSMYPLYLPGDKVLVLKQSTVNHSGDVGVIRYDSDKSSLKKLEYATGENWLRMVPINPLYPPQTITGADLERCEIIGIPTLLVREIK